MTVSDMSLDESGSNFAIVAATSLLLDVTRGSSDVYTRLQPHFNDVSCSLTLSICTSSDAYFIDSRTEKMKRTFLFRNVH